MVLGRQIESFQSKFDQFAGSYSRQDECQHLQAPQASPYLPGAYINTSSFRPLQGITTLGHQRMHWMDAHTYLSAVTIITTTIMTSHFNNYSELVDYVRDNNPQIHTPPTLNDITHLLCLEEISADNNKIIVALYNHLALNINDDWRPKGPIETTFIKEFHDLTKFIRDASSSHGCPYGKLNWRLKIGREILMDVRANGMLD